jgi:hypothetical protein
MASDEVRIRILRLDALAQAISTGLLAGLGILIATNWLVLRGGTVVGPNLILLSQFCPGYRVTFAGSLIGFAYGLAYGGAAGFTVSRLYNRIVEAREHRRGP